MGRWCLNCEKEGEAMNSNACKKDAPHSNYAPEWIWEILIVVIIAPAIAYSAFSLGNLPLI